MIAYVYSIHIYIYMYVYNIRIPSHNFPIQSPFLLNPQVFHIRCTKNWVNCHQRRAFSQVTAAADVPVFSSTPG